MSRFQEILTKLAADFKSPAMKAVLEGAYERAFQRGASPHAYSRVRNLGPPPGDLERQLRRLRKIELDAPRTVNSKYDGIRKMLNEGFYEGRGFLVNKRERPPLDPALIRTTPHEEASSIGRAKKNGLLAANSLPLSGWGAGRRGVSIAASSPVGRKLKVDGYHEIRGAPLHASDNVHPVARAMNDIAATRRLMRESPEMAGDLAAEILRQHGDTLRKHAPEVYTHWENRLRELNGI